MTYFFRFDPFSRFFSIKMFFFDGFHYLCNHMSGLYVHIPFCKSKCGYCAFYSRTNSYDKVDSFLVALDKEAQMRAMDLESPPETLYIGGGTPSLLSPSQFYKLVSSLERHFRFSVNSIREFTLEVNPDDVTPALISAWSECGVNRVSMGVQSLNKKELEIIGRRHSPQKALESYELLRRKFTNISLDLIFGLPTQSLESWETSVKEIISWIPEHISAYSLSIEERTRFSKMLSDGEISVTPDVIASDMYSYLCGELSVAGYDHYEISNYALPRKEAIHNSGYWSGKPYVGLGPGASSYNGQDIRRNNLANLEGYIDYFLSDKKDNLFFEQEFLTQKEKLEEYIMTRLRTSKGIILSEFQGYFGNEELRKLLSKARKENHNVVKILDGSLFLTETGFFVSDDVIVNLMPD